MNAEAPKSASPIDDSIWLEVFEPAFREDASLAERAAKLWFCLLSQIESGPEGITVARQGLENALRLTFPYTETCNLCRRLFQMSLAEDFEAENAPLTLLRSVMQRIDG